MGNVSIELIGYAHHVLHKICCVNDSIIYDTVRLADGKGGPARVGLEEARVMR